MDFEQKYQKDPGMNRVNLNLPISIKNDFRKCTLTLLWWRKGGGV